ncbi:hypothetical protein CYY_000523 [Polysphondylium violaceum]|uniref:Saposin B-type domain-containing protein n=1 Tax=Polysphondylium violaceum TaxID=133409 RepID=A0A8J4Q3F2_9MYCE|nr:hypothetical protein CYY_000523 [Polysphondylium violaceum]
MNSIKFSSILLLLLAGIALIGAVKVPITLPESVLPNNLKAVNGGSHCAACTLSLTLVQQYSFIHEKSIQETLDEICTFFPSKAGSVCTFLVDLFGSQIIYYFDKYNHADDVCHALNICTSPECRLFPNNSPNYFNEEHVHQEYDPIDPKVQENPWQWIQELINIWTSEHLPIDDLDKDKFSPMDTFRGSNWRGKDCDDTDANIRPGTLENLSEPNIDWNCNGIFGVNQQQQSYEDLLCGNSGAIGTIVSGDSAGAHFSLPPQWFNASEINSTTYAGIVDILEDEVDWPMRSAYTGYVPSTAQYSVQSVYLQMRERNLCNHRDYQNLGVNGANSGGTASKVMFSLNRNQTHDKPALFFLELIGNDVCSGHHTLDTQTTTEEFEKNILTILQYLDTQLPMGSHVVFVGLAQGGILWDSLWNRTHPIGTTYENVYNFLNCLQVSPCWGWMNPNETIRDATSQRAVDLSAVYDVIIKNYNFTHFDMQYYDFPFAAINQEWLAQGGQTWELIEPVDGFHPNQITNYLMGKYFFDQLSQDHPDWLGDINPNNNIIQSLFGNQGGY